MKLGTIVQRGLLAGVAIAWTVDLVSLGLSSKCAIDASEEFVDLQTMYFPACEVAMTCPDGAWSGVMPTSGNKHRRCAERGDWVRRSPLWRTPYYDGPTASYALSLCAAALALVAYPAAGRWLNPPMKLTDHDPDFHR